MKFNRNILFVLLAGLLAGGLLAQKSFGQRLVPEVTVDTQRLPSEAQDKLKGLDSVLTHYLQNQHWAGDDYQYDFPVGINIFFTDYTADPQEDHYKARLITTNKEDVRFEDIRWEFGLRPPFNFREGQFEPFKSVVEFYVWMLMGTEYDRLEKLGGADYYEKARRICLESSSSIYYNGWPERTERVRSMISDDNKLARELSFFFFTGIYFDNQQDYQRSKDYLYYALMKLDKLPVDAQTKFLEGNHRQFAEALIRAGYMKGVTALMQIDPGHKSVYETIEADSTRLRSGDNR